jgi:hypothetical protein
MIMNRRPGQTDDPRPTYWTPLGVVTRWLKAQLDDGVTCPCCGQLAKVYKRQINGQMARVLIMMHKASPDGGEVHLPTLYRGADTAKLAYWELIKEREEPRPDGGRAGWWCVTDKGRAFINGRIAVPQYARVYNGQLLNLTGPPVDIRTALGKNFDYSELMAS